MRALRWVGTGVLCALVACACSVPAPAESFAPGDSPGSADSAVPASRVPTPGVSDSVVPPPITEAGDPAAELDGRAVAGLAAGGPDVVLRIGAEGFRLPEDERILDVHGDRVLSARGVVGGGIVRLIVRDLEGDPIREFDPEMQLPQAAIVRGDDVYFGGIDLHEDADGFPVATDRGAWVARGDAPPEAIVPAAQEQVRYQAIERSPDGRTVGVTRCGETACSTFLIGPAGDVVEVPEPLLIALTNEVALLIGRFSDVTAYAIHDGVELWHAETAGVYFARYATTDGARIVMSTLEDAGDDDGNTSDQLRIEVWDALSGATGNAVLVSTERSPLYWLAPSLSSDRYVALLDTVLPDPAKGPHRVQIVDLEDGELLDLELMLGDVP